MRDEGMVNTHKHLYGGAPPKESPPNVIFDLMIEAEMINATRHWRRKRRIPLLLLMAYLGLRRRRRPVFKVDVLGSLAVLEDSMQETSLQVARDAAERLDKEILG